MRVRSVVCDQIKELTTLLEDALRTAEEKNRFAAAVQESSMKAALAEKTTVKYASKPCGCKTKCRHHSCGCKRAEFGCSKACGCRCDGCFNEHSYAKNAEGVAALVAVEKAELERGVQEMQRKQAALEAAVIN